MASQLNILGCSGGFGEGRRTTSFLWDQDTLIDAGTGVGDLSLDALVKIDQIFLTHSHLDHIVCIPFLADAVGSRRSQPLVVRGLPETLLAFTTKIFSDDIWPDFTKIPSVEHPFIRLEPLRVGDRLALPQGRSIQAIAVNHVVPAVGYLLHSDQGGALAFSGDTTSCPLFWSALNAVPQLQHVIVETSFEEAERDLAVASKHYCPSLLAQDLAQFSGSAQVHISHLKPGQEQTVLDQVKAACQPRQVVALSQGAELRF